MKALLISIKPKYVAKILNGEKTIEIRKTMPKCDLPIQVYIYCTKEDCLYISARGRRFGTYKDFVYCGQEKEYNRSGKVVAKFTLNKVEEILWEEPNKLIFPKDMLKNACLSGEELFKYLGTNGGYAWHISNLVIFDKPKELSEFCGTKQYFIGCESGIDKTPRYAQLTKAPQSWCYVEVQK